ncbi:Rieske (2Fe-2S) protein [Actinokineospora inagensis]|uniref:Rieske (2Fe-2S) protein n=1 Tax=Actinokineospora inagensis TaxID=103730 RepID=UPI00041AB447|nr:Rieske 2Fe-2S domain-containing protein [Actinokineospora inagensis]
MTSADAWHKAVTAAAELVTDEPVEPVIRQVSDDEVAITVGDREFRIPAECPHRKGRLVHAHLNARTLRVTCPLHRSAFDLATGCRVAGPVTGDLPVTESRSEQVRPEGGDTRR